MTMTEITDDTTALSKADRKNEETLEEEEAERNGQGDPEAGQNDMSAEQVDLNKTKNAASHQSEATKDDMTLETVNQDESRDTVNKPKDETLFNSDKSMDNYPMEAGSADLMNKTQYGVLDYIKTNDSPIQAVSQLTDVNGYTVQWRPASSTNTTRVTTAETCRDFTIVSNSTPTTGVNSPNEKFLPRQSNGCKTTDTTDQKHKPPTSVLELTVDKLKSSKSNGAFADQPDSVVLPSKIHLPSSAPRDILNEIKERAQLNRRKTPFVAKSPPPIFRGSGIRRDGRGRIMRQKNNMPAVAQFFLNHIVGSSANSVYADEDTNGGLDLSPPATIAEGSYVINRTPLRKIAPKSNGVVPTQPLIISTGPTTPPTNLTKSATDLGNNLISPIGRPIGSSKASPVPFLDASKWKTGKDLHESQEQPLDLCTKGSTTSSEASSAPSSPSYEMYDGNQPLNLSIDKPASSPNADRKPHQLPPTSGLNAGMWNWKTPPRSTFLANLKSGGTSSPLEGDTASDKAADSPGLDNQKLPYGFIMSPEIMNGLVPMGPISPSGQMLRQSYPEGAILLPGPGPHYRLSTDMALQHNEPPTPERPYMCDQCGATFKRNKSLKQHIGVHVNDNDSFQFGDNSDAMQEHAKAMMKSLPCEECPRKFVHPEQLKRHIRGHREIKTFICENEHCGKRFSDSSQLKLHMRTHSSHKPFPCPYCPLRFKYSGDVKRHVRIHTGEKPYVCGYCKMRFTQSNTLKQHERTHTGERPYHCHKCGMTFTQSGSLKYHLAHRHPPDVQTVIITTNAPTLTSGSLSGSQVMIMNPHYA
ncbi:uncharacterized protein [Amphiura filiformis]|uniref:uncharacterized protein n=1 Tax=Amphiura filiformis TaxID=82378 RepID=UPI003B214691